MYEVKKLKKVTKIMENFLIYKKNNCIYRDTGIFDEEIIINNYIQNNINFISELNSEIDRILSTWLGWLLISKKWNYEEYRQVIKVRSYIIILFFKRYKKEKIVCVTDLKVTI